MATAPQERRKRRSRPEGRSAGCAESRKVTKRKATPVPRSPGILPYDYAKALRRSADSASCADSRLGHVLWPTLRAFPYAPSPRHRGPVGARPARSSKSFLLLLDLLRAGSALSGPVRRGGTGPKSPQGRGQGGPRVRRQHRRCCRRTSVPAHGPAGQEARRARLWGALLFGYFLLGTQEKVTRSRERAEKRQDADRLRSNNPPTSSGFAVRAAPAAPWARKRK